MRIQVCSAADENLPRTTRAADFIAPECKVSRLFRDATLALTKTHPYCTTHRHWGTRFSAPQPRSKAPGTPRKSSPSLTRWPPFNGSGRTAGGWQLAATAPERASLKRRCARSSSSLSLDAGFTPIRRSRPGLRRCCSTRMRVDHRRGAPRQGLEPIGELGPRNAKQARRC